MSIFLWAVLPYLSIAIFIGGLIWRYRYDKFGWTTRSSQLYESRLLRIGSPLFHVGILMAAGGHVLGLVIPKSWMNVVLDQHAYHLLAVTAGLISGAMIVVGFAILVFRRRTVKTVFNATTVNDKVMYLLLGLTIAFGMANTISTALNGEGYNYRDGVSPWFRGIFTLQPNPDLMANAPIQFQAHALIACALFIIWPFSRLVHVFSAPIGYLVRPYIVYRSRGDSGMRPNPSAHAPKGIWTSPTSSKDR